MSFKTFMNSIREGLTGIKRHPFVTVASITTILLMLVILSLFFVFSANARAIMRKLGQQPPIEVYMKLQVSDEDLAMTEQLIHEDTRIIEVVRRSPEENYNNFKTNLGDSQSILDEFDYNMYLPYTFSVRISDPALGDEVVSRLETLPGVSKVSRESRVMDVLERAGRYVNIGTAAASVLLFVIALFIISTMVRISVYSRANEIEIMKFVGATNAYIRMPYVIEGGLIGLISAVCAWAVTLIMYQALYNKVMANVDPTSFYAILPTRSVIWWVLGLTLITGILIGGIGSGISVRKYIKV
ncbi:MAG: permease-like cell division protein FtsX [Clostridiales bacterium]|nr:permease-like cell division protein FtsX [Clostridiales bacterium]